MNDTRFKWLTCVVGTVIAVVAIAVSAMLIFSRTFNSKSKSYSKKSHEVGEYVYIQMYPKVVHIDRHCPRLNYKDVESKRVFRSEFLTSSEYSFCPKCVSDETYSELVEMRHNKYKNRFNETD